MDAKAIIQAEDDARDRLYLGVMVAVIAVSTVLLCCYFNPLKLWEGETKPKEQPIGDLFANIELNETRCDFQALEQTDERMARFLTGLRANGFFEDKGNGTQLTGEAYDGRLKQAIELYHKRVAEVEGQRDVFRGEKSYMTHEEGRLVRVRSRQKTPFAGDTSDEDSQSDVTT